MSCTGFDGDVDTWEEHRRCPHRRSTTMSCVSGRPGWRSRPCNECIRSSHEPSGTPQARDLVLKNVAELVTTPTGKKAGRPSNALTFDQATALMGAAQASSLQAYVVLSLMTGVRTEEARALRWDHVVAWVEDTGHGVRWRKPVSTIRSSRSTCGAPSGGSPRTLASGRTGHPESSGTRSYRS